MNKRVVGLAMVAALACGSATAQTAEVRTLTFKEAPDEVWSKVVRYLAISSIAPDSLDRTNGTIIASGAAKSGQWVSCEFHRGILRDVTYKLSVVMDAAPGGGTTVTVLMNGEAENARRRRIIVVPIGMSRTAVICPSTGELERGLFSYLEAK